MAVLWEIKYIFEQNLQHKTLFLLPPEIADPASPDHSKALIEQAIRIYAVGIFFRAR